MAAKVCYCSLKMSDVVRVFYELEKKRDKSIKAKMIPEREKAYNERLQVFEQKILVAIGFDFDIELPYKYIQEFCYKHCSKECRDSVRDLA